MARSTADINQDIEELMERLELLKRERSMGNWYFYYHITFYLTNCNLGEEPYNKIEAFWAKRDEVSVVKQTIKNFILNSNIAHCIQTEEWPNYKTIFEPKCLNYVKGLKLSKRNDSFANLLIYGLGSTEIKSKIILNLEQSISTNKTTILLAPTGSGD